jgi:hypothetical protein
MEDSNYATGSAGFLLAYFYKRNVWTAICFAERAHENMHETLQCVPSFFLIMLVTWRSKI